MKNYLTLALALTVVSAPAFASTARLEALGESTNGSYYVDDFRDIFLNPAQIVHYKKKLELELGSNTLAVPNSTAHMTPQGGFTNTFGDYTYGIYMNNNSDRTNRIIGGANTLGHAMGAITTGNNFVGPDSTVEVFFAGEMGVNWGVSVFYTGNNSRGTASTSNFDNHSTVNSTSHLLGARLGVETGSLNVFGLVGLSEDAKIDDAASNEIKGHFSWDLSATYKMDAFTWIARTQQYGADLNIGGAAAGTIEDRNHLYGLGLGYKRDVTKSINLFARIEADYFMNSNRDGGTEVTPTDKMWNVPLVLAAEAQALSWLTIRGSISNSLFGQENYGNVRNNLQGTTTVAAGLGLTFGDIQIDGLVATNGASNPAVNGTGTGSNQPVVGMGTQPQANQNFGFGDNFLTRIAMTYNF